MSKDEQEQDREYEYRAFRDVVEVMLDRWWPEEGRESEVERTARIAGADGYCTRCGNLIMIMDSSQDRCFMCSTDGVVVRVMSEADWCKYQAAAVERMAGMMDVETLWMFARVGMVLAQRENTDRQEGTDGEGV